MPKSLSLVSDSPESPKPRKRAARTHAAEIGRKPSIVDMVRYAFSRTLALAMVIGSFFGTLVPFSTFCVAHFERVDGPATIFGLEIPRSVQLSILVAIVVGGLAYSAWNVCQWMRLAKGNWIQAVGFTVLAELIMVGSHQLWLSIVVLVYLCAINAIATGVSLARTSRVEES